MYKPIDLQHKKRHAKQCSVVIFAQHKKIDPNFQLLFLLFLLFISFALQVEYFLSSTPNQQKCCYYRYGLSIQLSFCRSVCLPVCHSVIFRGCLWVNGTRRERNIQKSVPEKSNRNFFLNVIDREKESEQTKRKEE